jgi:ubiquinone/menaquinone biosynthesis C-methylase UbiE
MEASEKMHIDPIQAIKQDYYAGNVKDFDGMHIAPGDEHYISLTHISNLIRTLKVQSILDIGAGTGRGLLYMKEHHPEIRAHGVEPSPDMRLKAIEKGVAPDAITQGRGEKIPFPDGSFDATCEFGVVHHIERPNDAVREMMRVSTKAVFLSDGNRFGQGPVPLRWTKLLIYKAGLWPVARWVQTRGKKYNFAEDDGLTFSYSVYDSLPILSEWADRIYLFASGPEKPSRSIFHPLMTSSIMLLAAVRRGADMTEPI